MKDFTLKALKYANDHPNLTPIVFESKCSKCGKKLGALDVVFNVDAKMRMYPVCEKCDEQKEWRNDRDWPSNILSELK